MLVERSRPGSISREMPFRAQTLRLKAFLSEQSLFTQMLMHCAEERLSASLPWRWSDARGTMNRSKTIVNKGSFGNLKQREQRNIIRFKCVLTNTILDVLRQRPGWVEVKDEGEWDFYWCDTSWLRENFGYTYMDEHVRICHFRNHYELTRKNFMVKNLKRFRKQLEREHGKLEAAKCDFFPKTFELPVEYHLFVEEFKKNPGITWIMKPVARSQGKGIFLFRRLKDIMEWRKYIPLKAWLYRDGFARFSNTRFSLTSIDDNFIHLTNVAVQKTAPDYDPEKGCKWLLQQLRLYLTAKHGTEAIETLFRDMDNIFIKSLQSVQNVIINDKHCFELYGYDILINKNLKPWLLEVNASPSLIASSQEDYELKCRLLQDTVNVVDMEGRLTGKEKQVGGFDLMWNDGPVYSEDLDFEGGINLIANTHLGCLNDREKQLWHLLKPFTTQKKQQ
ncbi:probable tubulin polyglutamylase TTLL9 isoform X4 [Hypanus sabinus]|uniref:probable tubulin polyglutamylase TTLL9 isoform X4 n=1 Tax=Hypanus sabinus TaxID=79690 RepID=UPI0028C4F0AC|nr:probable tubulin polyglutamylase TTLL9 isoform X4 [Hypanus sabinus]